MLATNCWQHLVCLNVLQSRTFKNNKGTQGVPLLFLNVLLCRTFKQTKCCQQLVANIYLMETLPP
ncbi:MAG: hypothetical protein ACK5XR_06960, partial [Pseudanabaena sp.]